MISSYSPPPAQFNGIAIVGEAPGQEEEKQGLPFVGASGKELDRMLETAGIERYHSFLSNVFMERPEGNDISRFCCKKADLPKWYKLPPLNTKIGYIKPELLSHVERLRQELIQLNPRLVIALGNTAVWALCQTTAISKIRGTITESTLIPGLKVLPTFHPAAVLRAWELRVIVISDLMKARKESSFREIKTPHREIWIEPSLQDMYDYESFYLKNAELIAYDIETAGNRFITCIGFSPHPSTAIVVPFVDYRKPGFAYWPSLREEIEAWEWVNKILSLPISKVGQNQLYDVQYLIRHGIYPRNLQHDTMLLHHSIYPEMEKGLAFMGSIYTDEQAWKLLRPRNKEQAEKRDD